MELHQNYKMLEWKQTAYAGEEKLRLASIVKIKGKMQEVHWAKAVLAKLWVKLHGRSPGNSLAPDCTSEEQEETEGKHQQEPWSTFLLSPLHNN